MSPVATRVQHLVRSANLSKKRHANGRPRRWVDEEIRRLAPEKDYERIVHLVANYKMDDMTFNLLYAANFITVVLKPIGTEVLQTTGKVEERPQTRYLDTADFFWLWLLKGPSDPEVQKSITRLNRLHGAHYARFSEAFGDNEDWIFTLGLFSCGAERARSPSTPHSSTGTCGSRSTTSSATSLRS